jgi:amino acid transporter, AAT family
MPEAQVLKNHELHRGLKERHIQLMALGACLGAGLFLGSAKAIQLAGPAILGAYVLGGFIIFLIMRAMGELVVDESVAGSFAHYANRYLGKLAGYLTGWNYWFMSVIISITEITAVAIYMELWFPEVPRWYWSLAALMICGAVNMISVRFFGEIEICLAIIKILTVLILIIGGTGMIIWGFGNKGVPMGLDNLSLHNGFVPNGWISVIFAMPMVMFAYLGTEMIGITAAETKNPEKTIPRAIKLVLWRILFFYVATLFVLLAVSPWDQFNIHQSPFITVFERFGIKTAAGVINFVIIIAALSTGNGSIYASARMLFGLSRQNQAPSFFKKTSKNGVPHIALVSSLFLMTIGIALNYLVPNNIFIWLAAISTFCAIWTWAVILLAELVFRYQLTKENRKKLHFPMPFWPYSNIFALVFLVGLLIVMAILPSTRVALMVGPVFIGVLTITYFFYQRTFLPD